MKQFLRHNFVVICGIALPLLLAGAFFLAANVNGGAAPRTSLVYAVNYPEIQDMNPWQLTVRRGVLYASHVKAKPVPYNHTTPEIHIFDPVSGKDRKFLLPVTAADTVLPETIVPGFEKIKIDSNSESPDGFTFEENPEEPNLMTDLFGGNSINRNRYVLIKYGAETIVPNAPPYNAHFVGWVIP